jgi:hypothetical protein
MRIALLAAALALGACADASTVHTSYYNSGYTPGHVQLAAASGPSLAVIRNDPFPTDRNSEGVLAAMQARNFGPKMYFTQTPRPDDRYGYKVVMNFGPSIYGSGYSCAYEPTPPASTPPSGPINVSAAFCVGDILLTDAAGSVGGATGPDDPRFHRLIGDIMVALTPPYEINRGGDDCRGPGC